MRLRRVGADLKISITFILSLGSLQKEEYGQYGLRLHKSKSACNLKRHLPNQKSTVTLYYTLSLF